jgi:hypothetical protein
MDKPKTNKSNNAERQQINKNKNRFQKELDKEVEAALDKAFGKYPNIFKKVK